MTAVAAASSAAADEIFKNVHPASSSTSDDNSGVFKCLIGNAFSSCSLGIIQGTSVRICTFHVGFSIGGMAMPYKIIVAGLGGALIGFSDLITVRPLISSVHMFPALAPQLFDSRDSRPIIDILQHYTAPSLPFVLATSSYNPMINKHAIWSLTTSSGTAVGIVRSKAAPTGVGGGLALQEFTLTSAPALVSSTDAAIDLTLSATVDGMTHSMPFSLSSVGVSSAQIQAIAQRCGVRKAGRVLATTKLPADVAFSSVLDGPVASVLDFQDNALSGVVVCLKVGAFDRSSTLSCGTSDSNGTVQLPSFVLPPSRFLVGAIIPWHLVAIPSYSSSYQAALECFQLAALSSSDMETHSAVMFSGLRASSCAVCGSPPSDVSLLPIFALHPATQTASSRSGAAAIVYVHSVNSNNSIDLSRFPKAARATVASQQEVHILLQCRSHSSFDMLPALTSNNVVIPCPLLDGSSSSSSSSDGAWIEVLQLWDAERLFHPALPKNSVLGTPAATGAASLTVASWSVVSAAADATHGAATLMSVVLDRPEASMYVILCV
jgi:hypothetical protein